LPHGRRNALIESSGRRPPFLARCSLLEKCMPTIASPVELHALEKRREKELEEARSIQNVMLPNEALQAGMKIWIPPGLFDPSVSYEALELPLEPGIRSCFSPTDCRMHSTPKTRTSAWSGCKRCVRRRRSAQRRSFSAKYAAVSRFAGERAEHDDMAAAVFQYLEE